MGNPARIVQGANADPPAELNIPSASNTSGNVAIVAGMRVRVHGLRNNVAVNGREGTAVEFDAAQGRWKIDMDDGSGKMLKPDNYFRSLTRRMRAA